jgi:NAD(P)-dependent dehydrogenase (short-subunit alcohol dehydrogenase family)
MVGLDVARAHTASIFRSRPIVAVFAGATAGLGESTLRALAAAHGDQGKGLRVYVVGRKKASFDKVAADCRRVCPRGQFLFVQANDLALLADVDKACAEITKTEQENAKEGEPARVDLMCLSQGDFTFTERKGMSRKDVNSPVGTCLCGGCN